MGLTAHVSPGAVTIQSDTRPMGVEALQVPGAKQRKTQLRRAWKGRMVIEALTRDVQGWLEDGGVLVTKEVIQGALAALTFVVARSPEVFDLVQAPAQAFALLGEEISN